MLDINKMIAERKKNDCIERAEKLADRLEVKLEKLAPLPFWMLIILEEMEKKIHDLQNRVTELEMEEK
jgi:hypothetical protein